MIKVVATGIFKDGKKEEGVKEIPELVEKSKKDDGNISYVYCELKGNPNAFAILEEWESGDALNSHAEQEHFVRIVGKLQELVEKPLQVDVYEPLI